MNNPIKQFRGKYYFLSNFYPTIIKINDKMYTTVEHLYQASKALHDVDRERIRIANTPGQAKRIGNNITRIPNFDDIRIPIMEAILKLKFDQHPDVKLKLIETLNRELIEGNTWRDQFWGVCKGIGYNNLGKLLMSLRTEYQKEMLHDNILYDTQK